MRIGTPGRLMGRAGAAAVAAALVLLGAPVPASAASATVSIGNASVTEGNSGTTNMVFSVTTSGLRSPGTVDWATADGTAVAGSDYVSGSGTLSFSKSARTAQVTVKVNGDLTYEPDETFLVNLSNPTGITIATGQGTGTILNDDSPPTISVADASASESAGSMTFVVSLSAASTQTATVAYATSAGTATAGSDYTTASGTLSFAPGTTTKNVTVTIIDDTVDEANETFTLNLSSPTNATIADGTGVGTIVDDDGPPSVNASNPTVTEGNAGQKTMTFTVSLSAVSGKTITVDYATTDGTATAPSDYTAVSGTLTFNPGTTSQSVAVTIKGDTLYELDETFALHLSNASNASLGADGTGTITNDDTAPNMSISNVTVTEGSGGAPTVATLTVSLSTASGAAATATYATSDGTATAPSDYTAATGTVTVPAGSTTATITIEVAPDLLPEATESFTVALSGATHATLTAPTTGTVTITDDDIYPAAFVGDVSVAEGDTGTATATFPVTLNAVSGATITVDYATVDGTATAGTDYVAASGTLTFAPGDTSKSVDVTVNGDTAYEANETFGLVLSNPSLVVIGSSGTGTITNDDAAPVASISDVQVTEGTGSTTTATLSVTLSTPIGLSASVDWATSDGTATAPADYTAASGTVTFAPGEVSKTVSVSVVGDSVDEPNESFTVALSNPTNATLGTDHGTVSILDDDKTPTSMTLKRRLTSSKLKATGLLWPAVSGMKVTVTLYRKSGSKWRKVKAVTKTISGIKDRNGDGILEGAYTATFARPSAGTYKFVARYAGDADHLACSKTLQFKV